MKTLGLAAVMLLGGCGSSRVTERTEPFERVIQSTPGSARSAPTVRLSTAWSGAELVVRINTERVCRTWVDVDIEQGTFVGRALHRGGWDYVIGVAGLAGGGALLAAAPDASDEAPEGDESSPQDAAYFWGVALAAVGATVLGHGIYRSAQSVDEERGVETLTRRERERSETCDVQAVAGAAIHVRMGQEREVVGRTDADGAARVSAGALPRVVQRLLARSAGGAAELEVQDAVVEVEAAPWYEALHARALGRVKARDEVRYLRRFLELFPHSGARDEVLARVAQLEWEALRRSEDVVALLHFADANAKRPEGPLARARAAAVAWAGLTDVSDVEALRNHIQQFPSNADEARERLATIERRTALAAIRRTRDLGALRSFYQGSDAKVSRAALTRARSLRRQELRVVRQARNLIDNSRVARYRVHVCGFERGVLSYKLEMTGMGALAVLSGGFEQAVGDMGTAEALLEGLFRGRVSGIRATRSVPSCGAGWYL